MLLIDALLFLAMMFFLFLPITDHRSQDGANAALCCVRAGRRLRRLGDVDACASPPAARRDPVDTVTAWRPGSRV